MLSVSKRVSWAIFTKLNIFPCTIERGVLLQ